MKISKIVVVIALVISPVLTFAQSQFDKFEDIEGVSSVIVNKKAFSLMTKIGADSDPEYLKLIQNIDNLKVFATELPSVAQQMDTEIKKYLQTANLVELMRVKDEGSTVNIYIKEGQSEDYVKELLMFVKDGDKAGETVIISLTGNIDLKQISKLTKEMNLPGGEHLEKASK